MCCRCAQVSIDGVGMTLIMKVCTDKTYKTFPDKMAGHFLLTGAIITSETQNIYLQC